MLSPHELGRASPSRRAARRAWNTSDAARWDRLALPSGSWEAPTAFDPCTWPMNLRLCGPQPSGCFRALSGVQRQSGLKATVRRNGSWEAALASVPCTWTMKPVIPHEFGADRDGSPSIWVRPEFAGPVHGKEVRRVQTGPRNAAAWMAALQARQNENRWGFEAKFRWDFFMPMSNLQNPAVNCPATKSCPAGGSCHIVAAP